MQPPCPIKVQSSFFHSFFSSIKLFASLFELVNPQLDTLTCCNLWVTKEYNRMGIQLKLTRIKYEKQQKLIVTKLNGKFKIFNGVKGI
jgi:hypothetical protein